MKPFAAPASIIDSKVTKHYQNLTMPHGALENVFHPALRILAQQQSNASESIAKQTGFQKSSHFKISSATILFAADHGVVLKHPVSAFPQAVTQQMVLNFIHQGAAISVLSKRRNSPLYVCDVGVAKGPQSGTTEQILQNAAKNGCYVDENIWRVHGLHDYITGTNDLSAGNAMCTKAFDIAWTAGEQMVQKASHSHNPDVFVFGEMGIGNTTSAAAIVSLMLDLSPQECVGLGTGISESGKQVKIDTVTAALKRHGSGKHWQDVLRSLGGFEIVALSGAMVTAARAGKFILLDGTIATAALLPIAIAERSILDWVIAGHESAEPSHNRALTALNLTPLLKLQMRLGEGSGASLALGLILDAAAMLQDMATFESASISNSLSEKTL